MRTLSFFCITLCLVSPFIGLAQTPKEEVIDLGAGVKIELVLIPAGKFIMGSAPSEPGHSPNEIQHEVTLTKPFLMGKYEVTQSQWEAIMVNNPSSGDKGPMLPVIDVSWNDCQKFLKKLNEKPRVNSGCLPKRSGNMRAGQAQQQPSPLVMNLNQPKQIMLHQKFIPR
jgi:Uncharacterized conserved protein